MFSLGTVRANTGPTVKRDMSCKSHCGQGTFDLQVKFRPKGGFIVDPEFVPKRTRTRPVTNAPHFVEDRTMPVAKSTSRTDLSQVSL